MTFLQGMRMHILVKVLITFWGKLTPKNAAHSLGHSRCCLPHVFGAPRHSPWMLLQCSSSFPWLGSGFVDIQWMGSLLGIFVLFLHSHGWEFHVLCVAQPMGDKSTISWTKGVVLAHVKS